MCAGTVEYLVWCVYNAAHWSGWLGWDEWRVLGDGWYKPQHPAPLHPATQQHRKENQEKKTSRGQGHAALTHAHCSVTMVMLKHKRTHKHTRRAASNLAEL